MKYCFIVNPQARNGRSRRQLERLHEAIKQQGFDYDFHLAQGLEEARRLSQEANRAGYEVIVAVGGDGTINRVINGFYGPEGRRLSAACLGVVHTGTSPDLCRTYGIPTDPAAAVATLTKGVVRSISIGRVVFTAETVSEKPGSSSPLQSEGKSSFVSSQRSDDARLAYGSACRGVEHQSLLTSPTTNCWGGQPEPAYFACCANIGLGAQLARLANSGIRKYAGDFLGTFISLLRALASYRPRNLQIVIDGHPKTMSRAYNISVGKTFYIASGLKVRHLLGEQDPRFYVLSVSRLSWANLVPVLWTFYRGRAITNSDCLTLEYAREVKLNNGTESTEIEFDGDPAGLCPCQIDTATDPLDLIAGPKI